MWTRDTTAAQALSEHRHRMLTSNAPADWLKDCGGLGWWSQISGTMADVEAIAARDHAAGMLHLDWVYGALIWSYEEMYPELRNQLMSYLDPQRAAKIRRKKGLA